MSFRDSDRFQEIRVPLTWTATAATLVAAVLALVLLLGDRRETLGPEGYGPVRAGFDAGAAPVSGVLAAPVRWVGDAVEYVQGYFFAISENRRLRRRVAELERYRQAAIALQDVNERYAALLQLRTLPPTPMVGARIVTDVRGPYVQARLADTGSERGVRIGNPAMSELGLVGRVVGVSRGASRILMLTDAASRTPVMVDRTNARAVLTGDSSPRPVLAYLRGQNPVKAGDLVMTSGDGGVFPRGLPVGEAIRGADGEWRVRLFADRSPMDFVRIVQFQDFTQTIDQAALGRSVMPPAPPLPQPPAPTPSPAATASAPATTPAPVRP